MPVAGGSIVQFRRYGYEDQDAYRVEEMPPIQNTWYTGFNEECVRHILAVIRQRNDESAAKVVEVKWTIDGNVYFISVSLDHDTPTWIYRNRYQSSGGTAGLGSSATIVNAAHYVDKRGLAYKTEVRMVSALGTNQSLSMWDVAELEVEN